MGIFSLESAFETSLLIWTCLVEKGGDPKSPGRNGSQEAAISALLLGSHVTLGSPMNPPFEPPFFSLVKGYPLTFPQGVPVRNGQGNALQTGILEEAEGEGGASLRAAQACLS